VFATVVLYDQLLFSDSSERGKWIGLAILAHAVGTM
jgi:hypothetical protein